MSGEDGRAAAAPGIGRPEADHALRIAVFFGALFLMYGVHLPYLPVWLDWRGLSAGEIAVIMSAPFFLRLLVTPAVSIAADARGNHRSTVVFLAWTCLVLALLTTQMSAFWAVCLTAIPFHLASATIMPLTETVAVRAVREASLNYGRMRLWGSLTFIAIGLAGGAMLEWIGPAAAVWLLVLGAAATVAAAHGLPQPSGRAAGSAAARPGPIGPDALRLVRSRKFLAFLMAVGIIQATHGTFYAFGAIAWQTQGISTAWVGALWAIAVLAEVGLFAFSSQVLGRIGAVELVATGAAAALVRWSIMALEPGLAVLAPLQLLHGLTYGATHIGAMHFIGRAVPEAAAGTAQALYATFAAGVFMGGVMLASGPGYGSFGARVYVGPALLAVVGLALALWLARRWDGGLLWLESAPDRDPVVNRN